MKNVMNYDKLKFYHWVEPDVHYQLTSVNAGEYAITWYEDGAFHTDDAIYSKKEIGQYLSSGIWKIINN